MRNRKINITITGPNGEGKSTIAAFIHKALADKGIPVDMDATIARVPVENADGLPCDEVEVFISEAYAPPSGVLKEGSVKDAAERSRG